MTIPVEQADLNIQTIVHRALEKIELADWLALDQILSSETDSAATLEKLQKLPVYTHIRHLFISGREREMINRFRLIVQNTLQNNQTQTEIKTFSSIPASTDTLRTLNPVQVYVKLLSLGIDARKVLLQILSDAEANQLHVTEVYNQLHSNPSFAAILTILPTPMTTDDLDKLRRGAEYLYGGRAH